MSDSENNLSNSPAGKDSEGSGSRPSSKVQREINSPRPRSTAQSITAILKFLLPSVLLFVAGAGILGLLGLAQRVGWITSGTVASTDGGGATTGGDMDYICPMMCTPPQKEPGRCPVCAMELVPASSGGGGDERSVVVDPASRRVANIQTVAARRVAMIRAIRAVGEIQYDESSLKTISAYSDGRFDKLYVDYTGALVEKGDRLASFYSPELYSAQVEYVEAAKAVQRQSSQSLASVADVNRRMLANVRQRLIELGMTETQIDHLAASGDAQSRLDIIAPMSGTVIEKVAVEGEYVKEGQAVFRLADLSRVWLILKLFPEDAASIRYGQRVEATVKSLPGQTFTGRVAFIDPEVERVSRTVEVRVVIENAKGQLRVGDYAKATIQVPISNSKENQLVYDPELAKKWISPRHPHIISEQPGECPLCQTDLVPASEFGFTDQPQLQSDATVIPRNALLMAAGQSVVYVETEPGRFEIRRVLTGATSGENVAIVKGLAEGEAVATNGNFLLDSQMQLAGNPSLIDPTRAPEPMQMIPGFDATMLAEIRQLPDDDQQIVLAQMVCPITEMKLGSMGVPPKVLVNGEPVFICCEGCREGLLEEPEANLKKLKDYRANKDKGIPAEQAKVPDLPSMGAMTPLTPGGNLPPMGAMMLISPGSKVSESDSVELEKVHSAAGEPSGRIQ